jgi:hypothetical protein
MIWMTWRQFRPGAITAGVALVALAAALVATRPSLLSLYTSSGLPGCHAACGIDAQHFISSVQGSYTEKIFFAGIGIMYLGPALIGLFWGAPLIARELDSGTFRLAWSQSVTRARWATVKLTLIGCAALLTAGVMSLLIGWWSGPLYHAAGQAGPNNNLSISRFSAPLFSTTGIVPLGYAAFAFALGAAAGVLLRRPVRAMAVTFGAFVAIQVLVPMLVRPYLIPPVHTTQAVSTVQIGTLLVNTQGAFFMQVQGIDGQQGAWIVGDRLVGAAGQTVTRIPAACAYPFGNGTGSSCLARRGIKIAVSYQPASRYWEIQSAETGMYLVLAAGLGGLSYWALRSRQRAA